MNLFLQVGREDHLDVFTFYPLEHAIFCPSDLWFDSLAASLRMKHAVLILETETTSFPAFDKSQRWEVGDNWSWLAPRGLSVISEVYNQSPFSYGDFKLWLKTHK